MTRLSAALAAFLALSAPAFAVSTVPVALPSNTWVNLNTQSGITGPLSVQAFGGVVEFVCSDTQPSSTSTLQGFLKYPEQGAAEKPPFVPCQVSTTTWAFAYGSGAFSSSATVIVTAAIGPNNPSVVAGPTPSTGLTNQAKIATTGTAVQLNGGVSYPLKNGITITAWYQNTNPICVGFSSSVTNVYDGTGNGYCIPPGMSSSWAVSDASLLWVNGTAADKVMEEGN